MNHLRRVSPLLQEGGLYLWAVMLPFSKAATEIAFGVLLLGWLLERIDPQTRRASLWWDQSMRPLAIAVIAYLGACSLSVLVSTFPATSVAGLIQKWLEYVLLLVIGADVGRRQGIVKRALILLAFSSFLVVIEVLAQERFGVGLFRGRRLDFYRRVTGPYENPIDLATYLMVVTPVLVGFSWGRRGLARVALWTLVAALSTMFAMTKSLGAFLGLGAGILLSLRRRILRPSVLLVTGVALIAVWAVLQGTGILRGILFLVDVGKTDRWMMWQAALRMILDRPILGHGVNTFMANYLTYWVGGEQQPRYAHNCYLQVAAETGLVGLAALAVLLWRLASRLTIGMRRSQPRRRPVLAGMAIGLLAFIVQAGFDTNFYSLRQAALFWTLSGLAIGYATSDSRTEGTRPSPSRQRHAAAHTGLVPHPS